MSNVDALLAAVVAKPDDEVARLAYADALDDAGTERGQWLAAMIRSQWKVFGPARMTTTWPHLTAMRNRGFGMEIDGITYELGNYDDLYERAG